MSAWLAVLLVSIVVAAAVGASFLRRSADRQWAEHVRRQRIAAMPQYQQLAKDFVRVQIQIRDALTPGLQQAAASIAQFARALDALPRPPWWKRILIRARTWFA